MKVEVDLERCIGSGMCTTLAPQVFSLNAAGDKVTLLTAEIPPDIERAVEDAEACCPVEAITVAR